jgi:hypothetical protein
MKPAVSVKHIAWDQGAIIQGVAEVTGFVVPQKTTKTMCDKRVALLAISNNHPTCKECENAYWDMVAALYL